MAVPKAKTSKQRKHTRSANWKLSAINLVECPSCHELKQCHRVCKSCGQYDKTQVIEMKTKESK